MGLPDGGILGGGVGLSTDGGLTTQTATVPAVEGGFVSEAALVVELESFQVGQVAELVALVELEADADLGVDVIDIRDCVSDIVAGVRASEERLRAHIDGGGATERELGSLQAALTGFRADIDECRATLDAADVAQALLYREPADTIRIWRWERAVRDLLIRLDARLREALEVLADLITGRVGRRYAVRTGDTLQSIAARELGDWREWKRLAELNDITPDAVAPGTVLIIPERR